MAYPKKYSSLYDTPRISVVIRKNAKSKSQEQRAIEHDRSEKRQEERDERRHD